MTGTRVVALLFAFATLTGCTGGGGGSSSTPPSAAWTKFRHDLGNTGQGSGGVVRNPGGTPTPVSILWATKIDGSKISASPAVGINGTLFVGSEGVGNQGGTLAALDPDGGASFWPDFVHSCEACGATCQASTDLGALTSSPAVFTNGNTTSLVVGSTNGSLMAFQFTDSNAPVCAFCFRPVCMDGTAVSFVSSPTFMVNIATGDAAGLFIGAKITDTQPPTGRLYAVNTDGSLQWQFPRPGEPAIGPISSSPAFGLGNTLYFTTDDGVLYALTPQGDFKWKVALAGPADIPLAPSAVANATSIITSSTNGVILALNPDGSFHWDTSIDDPGDGFGNSLAVGFPAQTPTPTEGAATPTPPAGAPPTFTPLPFTALTVVVGVHQSGKVSVIDAATGLGRTFAIPRLSGPVSSSPLISTDGYIVVGDHDGLLHAISTLDGTEPRDWNWPIALVPTPGATPQPIRSSPSVDSTGTVYVGSDDGYLYAVGPQ